MNTMRELEQYGIGHAEHAVLMHLAENDNINQDTIARHLIVDKGSIARTLRHLECKGYIHRKPNEANGREKLISLTEKGVRIIGDMRRVSEDWYQGLFEGLTDEERLELERIITIMAANSTKALKKGGRDDDGKCNQ